MENKTNPVLVHRGKVHTASSSLSHPSIDLMINCFDDHNSDDHHYLHRFDCLFINCFDDHSRDDHSHNLVIVWCGLSGSISMLAMYFSRRSFSSLRLSRLVMLLALRERDDQLPFIVIVIIVRIAMITIASYCSPLREYLYGHHHHQGHHDCLPPEIITMVIETTCWTQLRLNCSNKKVFMESH